jgi:hypothetical protein
LASGPAAGSPSRERFATTAEPPCARKRAPGRTAESPFREPTFRPIPGSNQAPCRHGGFDRAGVTRSRLVA